MKRLLNAAFHSFLFAWLFSSQVYGQDNPQGKKSPGRRATHCLIYDEVNRKVVLLNGTYPAIQPESGLAELWAWDGRIWEKIGNEGPEARYVSSAVYDSKRDKIIVYGGRIGKGEIISGDTWEWSEMNWMQMTDSSVGKRDHQMMAYDTNRGMTVMFGGGKFPRTIPWARDTWEWDGKNWKLKDSYGPLGRVASMVYDKKNKMTVLFGGVGEPKIQGEQQPLYKDTWGWNGKVWKRLADEGPPARSRFAMCYEDESNTIVLYGGEGENQQYNDMWKWDGIKWTEIKLNAVSPGKRSLHAMVYDASRRKIVLYGGNRDGKVVGDTWEWDGNEWREIK